MSDISILLIDDDDVAAFLVKRLMDPVEAISEVRIAADGRAGLEVLSDGFRPTVILLDINMPRMNGFEFLEAYAELDPEVRARTVVVMLTTSLLERDEERANATGLVDEYITKPLTAEHIEAIVARLS